MSDWKPPVLETERLYLRPIEESDADSVFIYASNEDVALYTSWYAHTSIDDSYDFIRNYVDEHYQKQIAEPWGITLKENPEMVIGTVGLTPEMVGNHVMRFHYGLSRTFWGQGIIPEAGERVVEYAFEHYNAKRIWAFCTTKNIGSAKALQKIGFQEEGVLRSALYSKGEYRDMWSFGLLIDDWQQKKQVA